MEFNTIKDLLQSTEQRLIEAQASITERQKEIEVDLADCRKALAALEPIPKDKEKVERVPKNGDVLLALESDEYTTLDKEYIANISNETEFYITDDEGGPHWFSYENWRQYFRFKDEQLTKRVPKKGDILVATNHQYFKNNEYYEAISVDEDNGLFDVINQNSGEITTHIPIIVLQIHFRFKDEQPTDEDKENLHSFQHVNQEPKKKAYRIKTREEMLASGANTDGDDIWMEKENASFTEDMAYLHGKELDTNKEQKIKPEPHHAVDYWTIETWMITENK